MQEAETIDWYDVLQVSRHAEREVIDAAYKRLARKYHPDQNAASDASERMRSLNRAYEVLSDPERRARYDRERFADTPEREPEPEPRRDEEGVSASGVESQRPYLQKVGDRVSNSVYKLWTTAAIVLGAAGPLWAVFIVIPRIPAAPEWSGSISVVSNSGETLQLPAEQAQVKFMSSDARLRVGERVPMTKYGITLWFPPERAQEALVEGWHFSNERDRDEVLERRRSAQLDASGFVVGTPLLAFALFRWGLWLVRNSARRS